MRINHNIAALNTHRQLGANQASSGKNLEKLSSGLRINRAGDDAAGLAISEKMRAQIRGLDMASKNAQDSISLIQTAEGAMNETHSILQRMRELAVQSSNDTNTKEDREKLQQEVNQLTSEINRIGKTTEFNNKKLLDGSLANTLDASGKKIATGADAGTTNLTVGLTGTSLTAGDYELTVTKSTDVRADKAISVGLGDTVYSNASAQPKFAADGIEVSGTDPFTSVAQNWTLTKNADDTFTLSNGLAAGNPYQVDGQIVKVGEEFEGFGLKFTISDDNGAAAGDTIQFSTQAATAETLNTVTNGWTTVDPAAAGMTGAGKAEPTWTTALTATSEAEAGDYELVFGTSGADRTITVKKDGTEVAVIKATDAYDNLGIKFQVSDVKDVQDGDTISFKVEDTFSYSAQLKKDGVNVGSAVDLAKNVTGDPTLTDSKLVPGLELDGTGVTGGTYKFTVEDDVKGADNSLGFQIGSNQNQTMSLAINDIQASALKIVGTGTGFSSENNVTDGTNDAAVEKALDVTSAEGAANAITVLDNAINTVSTERSKLGAVQNRLEHTINNLGTSSENLTAAESRIRDVDMAKEMMEFTKNNILSQAAQAMLAQANQQPQGVLQLLG